MTQMFSFRHNGRTAHASVGYYDDGRPGEVFLNVGTVGSELQVVGKDSAVAVSIAMQHGVALDTLRGAMCRLEDGSAEGPLGQFLDMFAKGEAP